MSPWSSFRVRLLAGSLLWTAGLLYVAHLLSVLIMIGPRAFTGLPRIVATLIVAVLAMAAGVWLARTGLSSFSELRRRLSDVRNGRTRQIGGRYPTEVQPLVDDLNALLAHRDARVSQALAKAGDLAHGLKTPLALLAHDAERADAAGDNDLADAIRHQVERMRRQVDYHLAHARAAASGATPGMRCPVAESVAGLARTLDRLYAGRGVAIDAHVAADYAVQGQREDLDEMLGNLLDNACKWAKTRVTVTSSNGDGGIVITVDDDGPGLAPSLRGEVLRRGVRADEASPGSGFGLAIVRDLAELHGGAITLDSSTSGGLRARLRLPAAG